MRHTIALILALSLAAGAGGLFWAATRRPSGPLGPGRDAYSRGDWETAARVARARLKEAADDFTAMRLLARASVRLGRDAGALWLYDQLGLTVLTADDFSLLGTALSRTGDRAASVEVWEQGLRADPDHPEILSALIRAYLEEDRFQAAAEAARRLARNPAWRARADALMGRILMSRNDPSGAAESWRRALGASLGDGEPSPTSAPEVTRKDLARALLLAGRPAEARDELRILLARGPDREGSWLLSRAYLQEKAMPEALAALNASEPSADADPTLPDPAPFIGAAKCAECHREKFDAQQHSRHSRTFYRASELSGLAFPRASLADPADPAVTHALRRSGDRVEYEAHTPDRIFRAVIDYAFGSGDRGKTLVGREASGQAYELRLSLYHEGKQSAWDVTSGHPRQPATALGYLGLPLTEDAARACVGCHVTNPESILGATGPESADPAIGCEKCHGPGGNHVLAVAAGFPELAIGRPSLASGASVVSICAQCHSPRGRPVSPEDPTSVRFQGSTLTWSRCYTESGDRLDCTTCHDPHRDASTSAAYYEAKCLACHGGGSVQGAVSTWRPCPVNPTRGCLPCHMPKVSDAIPHSPFTDHFIRVHRDSKMPGGG